MPKLEIENLNKSFGKTNILKNVHLSVNEGEFVVLVGPSGSGKSTILRLISGLEMPTSGSISIDEDEITNLPPKDRNISMVFQNYALYPHMSIFDNLAFPLKIQKFDTAKIKDSVNRISEILGIRKYLDKKPKELSGGERQRVALGRAIIRNPKILLMDEPLSNLDAKLRTHMRGELLKLHKSLSNTIIYVTHDQIEALTMGDRIVVLNHGEIQQIDTPAEIYNNPKNIFVASFIGNPSINLFDFSIGSGDEVFIDGNSFSVSFMNKEKLDILKSFSKIIIGIRSENLCEENATSIPVKGRIDLIEVLGSESILYVRPLYSLNSSKFIAVKLQDKLHYKVGDDFIVNLDFSKCYFFDPVTTNRIFI